MQDDSGFLPLLGFPDLKKEYIHRKKVARKKAHARFNQEKESIQEHLEKGIREDQSHTAVLNACIFPFLNDGEVAKKLGYVFLAADPLRDSKMKNLDFLIVKSKSSIAVFGDAKGPMVDPDYGIDDVRQKIKTVAESGELVSQRYFGGVRMSNEFVLGIDSEDAVETTKALARKGGNMVVWQASRSPESTLSVVAPPTNDSGLRKSMLHQDEGLNQMLRKVRTTTSVYSFFPQSHTYSKLTVLTLVQKKDSGSLTFSRDELVKLVKETIPYAELSSVETEVDLIINHAMEIGFLRKDGTKYGLISRHREPSGLVSDLKKRWLISRLDKRRAEMEEEEIDSLQAELLAEKAKRPTLI